MTTLPPGLSFRETLHQNDSAAVRALVESTGFFYPDEIDMAEELVAERLEKGLACGYHFLFLEDAGKSGEMLGYTCYGPSDADPTLIDLYWIAVRQGRRGAGLGTHILRRTEELARDMGARLLMAETSSRELYAPTRGFYLRHGFLEVERIKDFYRPGDHKVVYCKELG